MAAAEGVCCLVDVVASLCMAAGAVSCMAAERLVINPLLGLLPAQHANTSAHCIQQRLVCCCWCCKLHGCGAAGHQPTTGSAACTRCQHISKNVSQRVHLVLEICQLQGFEVSQARRLKSKADELCSGSAVIDDLQPCLFYCDKHVTGSASYTTHGPSVP